MKRHSLLAAVALWTASLLVAAMASAFAQGLTLTIKVDSRDRTALVFPGKDAATSPSPVVLVFHPLYGTRNAAQNMADFTRFHVAWPEATVAYPLGPPGSYAWQNFPGEGDDQDIRFVEALLKELSARYQVDERRVYASGWSNGGNFTWNLLSMRPELFAAFAPVATGGLPDTRWATVPRPVLIVMGKKDWFYEAERSLDEILRLNGCAAATTEWAPGIVLYQPCGTGQPVLFWAHDGGHDWPPMATERIVQFFKQHALPEPPGPLSTPGKPDPGSVAAGTGKFGATKNGDPAAQTPLAVPTAVTLDGAGNLYVMQLLGVVMVQPDGLGRRIRAQPSDLLAAEGLVADREGNVYIAQSDGRIVQKRSATGSTVTIAGTPSSAGAGQSLGFAGDGGPATQAVLAEPFGLALDALGNLFIFIADRDNHRVRKVAPDGIITTVAGTGVPGFSGDGGPATVAQLDAPSGLAVDGGGSLWIADTGNRRIRVVDGGGKIRTVAGNGSRGFSGDGGQALAASLDQPIAVAVDREGSVFLADSHNRRVRKVAADGVITTVFGGDWPGGEGVRYAPASLAIDRAGTLLIADPFNQVVWKVAGIAAPGLIAGQPFPAP